MNWQKSALSLLVAVSLASAHAQAGELPSDDRRSEDGPGETLNLSRDLARLGIAERNLPRNDPSVDARPLFEAAVHYVATHDVHRLTVDRGTYYF